MERLPFRNPVLGVPQFAGLPALAPSEQDVYATKFLWHAYAFMVGKRTRILETQMVAMNQVACAEMAGVIQMAILVGRSGGISA
jgi:hypothetical protein